MAAARAASRAVRVATSAAASRDALEVGFDDGLAGRFHALWLRDNCPSRRSASNQKTRSAADLPAGGAPAIARAGTEGGGARVHVDWAHGAPARSTFDAAWLYQHAYRARPPRHAGVAPPARLPLPRLAYADVSSSDGALFAWLRHLADVGACILEGAPDSPEAVCAAAERIAPVQATVYGRSWEVAESAAAINVAYTAAALPLHMDLAYYESPPGLQLLHCRAFDACVAGGESVLLDGLEAAALFAAVQPRHSAALAAIPATFIKEHFARERPVCMRYRRPHIALGAGGDVTGLFWSPPFEGPLCAPPEDVPRYYAAYAAFDAFLAEQLDARGWTFRLRPGEVLTFNNRRLLHGRAAFAPNGGARLLQGCYVHIDEFASRYATLAREHGGEGEAGARAPEMRLPKLGNQDHANGVGIVAEEYL